MELQKYFGQSGTVYFVAYSPETYWHAFVETKEGLVKTEAKGAEVMSSGKRLTSNSAL
jgi:hypothetical protein